MKIETLFGKVLREVRKKRGISQESLALQSGLDRTFISLLERDLRQPTLSSIFQIAKALGIAPSELIKMVETKANENYKN